MSLLQPSPTFLAPGTGFMEDNFSTDGGEGNGPGRNVSDGERWGAAHEASLPHPPLTSCCAARLLMDHWRSAAQGIGDPCCTSFYSSVSVFILLSPNPKSRVTSRAPPTCSVPCFYICILLPQGGLLR